MPLVRGVAVELCNLRAGAAYNGLSGGFTTSEMVIETSTSNLLSIELGMDPYASFCALHWRPSFHMFFNHGFAIYGDRGGALNGSQSSRSMGGLETSHDMLILIHTHRVYIHEFIIL